VVGKGVFVDFPLVTAFFQEFLNIPKTWHIWHIFVNFDGINLFLTTYFCKISENMSLFIFRSHPNLGRNCEVCFKGQFGLFLTFFMIKHSLSVYVKRIFLEKNMFVKLLSSIYLKSTNTSSRDLKPLKCLVETKMFYKLKSLIKQKGKLFIQKKDF
jgi:hypothetical protein